MDHLGRESETPSAPLVRRAHWEEGELPAFAEASAGGAARRLLEAFFDRLKPATLKAYRADLADLAAFVAPPAQPTLLPGIVAQEPTEAALGRLLRLDAGHANDLVLRWRRDMQKRKLAPSTVNRRLAAVRTLTGCARMLGMITWEICVPGVHCITLRDTRGPGAEAAERMMGEDGGTADRRAVGPKADRERARNRAILALLSHLALRRAEVCSLTVGDVDLDGGRVWVLRKGYEEKQVLSMTKAAGAAVAAWMAVRGDTGGTDALFIALDRPGRCGPLDGASIYRMVRKSGAAAGVPKARPHGLRHTAITQAVEAATEAGLSLDEVRQFSGHKHLATLLRYRDQVRDVQGQLAEAVALRMKRAGQGGQKVRRES